MKDYKFIGTGIMALMLAEQVVKEMKELREEIRGKIATFTDEELGKQTNVLYLDGTSMGLGLYEKKDNPDNIHFDDVHIYRATRMAPALIQEVIDKAKREAPDSAKVASMRNLHIRDACLAAIAAIDVSIA